MTAFVLTAKVALVLPRGTVTLAGFTPAKRRLLTESAIFALVGAGPVSVTVPFTELPPLTELGESVIESTPTGSVTAATLEGAESPPPLVARTRYMKLLLPLAELST